MSAIHPLARPIRHAALALATAAMLLGSLATGPAFAQLSEDEKLANAMITYFESICKLEGSNLASFEQAIKKRFDERTMKPAEREMYEEFLPGGKAGYIISLLDNKAGMIAFGRKLRKNGIYYREYMVTCGIIARMNNPNILTRKAVSAFSLSEPKKKIRTSGNKKWVLYKSGYEEGIIIRYAPDGWTSLTLMRSDYD